MKYSLLLFYVFSLLLSCSDSNKGRKCESTMLVYPKENIKAIIDSFTFATTDSIHELYINKIDPHNYDLYLFAGEHSLARSENLYNNQFSLAHILSNGKQVDIYSGIEHYFNLIPDSENQKEHAKHFTSMPNGKFLLIRDSMNVISIYDTIPAYPFIPFPLNSTIKYEPPREIE